MPYSRRYAHCRSTGLDALLDLFPVALNFMDLLPFVLLRSSDLYFRIALSPQILVSAKVLLEPIK